ncbi:uncharacterized protein LY89DRAFT_160211 [Mollisia scopiformis]|uniref:Uncharacterized protein n=1 Tax=Mollisia scopiformis TaxID=149040 RepID=A0A194X053_MOLSC|nr:uncharacterized protein LY89DRAFT_160211 [Mollisia scopiformis]KUJ13575.1 hypothetical protein LY89DRAFT_160211 [Mollisia scopiformis]
MPIIDNTPVSPYQDYVSGLVPNKHGYLAELLQLQRSGPQPTSNDEPVFVNEFQVLDIVDGKFACQVFRPELVGPVDQQFTRLLEEHPEGLKSRFLIFRHNSILRQQRTAPRLEINGNYLNAISSRFELDPSFLEKHFALCELHQNKTIPRLVPVPLPKDGSCLQIMCNSACHFTMCRTKADGHKIVVIFGFHYYEETEDIPDLTNGPFQSATTGKISIEDVLAIQEQPLHLLYNTILDALLEFGMICFRAEWDPRANELTAEKLLERRQRLRTEHLALAATRRSLGMFSDKSRINHGASDAKWRTLTDNLTALLETSDKINTELKDHLQSTHSIDAIEEARRGLRQNETLKRLTIVAFIFIPVNLSCAFFSMNVKQLNNSSMDIGYFFLGILVSGFLAWALAAAISSTFRALARARAEISKDGRKPVSPNGGRSEPLEKNRVADEVPVSWVI